jgi:serine/threonine protein kinase
MTESASRSPISDPRFLAPVQEGQTVADKYVIGKLIDVGGMGAVFEARDIRLDRRVAIKVLLPRLASSITAAERFKREARTATRITSEHVVKVLEIGDLPDGTPFLAMEYLEGQDLRAVLREHGPLSPRLAVDYLLQALQAVAEGHMAAVVHRDLKPSNLFLAERADGTPLIKVLDFGIAKTQLDSLGDFALTSSDDVQLGSPTYMPPEQFQNPRDVDARADIWALGVTLYELITGRVPFSGHTYAELISQVLSGQPESIESVPSASAMPDGLEAIIARCLAKNRDQRYENAVALAVALAPYGSDDARLSLTRVSGLVRPRSPNPAGSPREPQLGFEATLPVPVDLDALDRTATSSSRDARQAPGLASRRWLGGAAVIAVSLGAGAAFWFLEHRDTPASVAHPPQVLTSSVSAAQVALPPPALSVGSPPTVTVTPVQATPIQSGLPARADGAPPALVGPPKSTLAGSHAKASITSKPRSTAGPSSSTPPAVVLSPRLLPPPIPSSEPPSSGPSQRIEDLIETRH